MIHFACPCGQTFDLPDDRAGDEMQCPHCLRLVDVPRLGELDSFNEDGTLKMSDAPETAPALAEKMRAFAHRDDLRQNIDEFLSLDDAPAADAAPTKLPPRYDPETGELMEMIDVLPEFARIAPEHVPVGKPALTYTSLRTEMADKPFYWWHVPWRLMHGLSLMAIGFVVLTHVLIHLALLLPGFNLLLVLPVCVAAIVIVTHYLNVMDEFGPRQRDSAPVLLRNVSIGEDVLHPFYALCIAVVICFAPLIVMAGVGGTPLIFKHTTAFAVLAMCGSLVFPAVVFTAATSGALQNLTPARVFSVIRAAPTRYMLAWIAFAVGIAAYGVVLPFFIFSPLSTVMAPSMAIPWDALLVKLFGLYGLITLAVYCMHLSAAWMGMIYRNHHEDFDWVYQDHHRAKRTDVLAELQRMRRQGDPRLRRQPPQKVARPIGARLPSTTTPARAQPVRPIAKPGAKPAPLRTVRPAK